MTEVSVLSLLVPLFAVGFSSSDRFSMAYSQLAGSLLHQGLVEIRPLLPNPAQMLVHSSQVHSQLVGHGLIGSARSISNQCHGYPVLTVGQGRKKAGEVSL